MTRSSSIAVAVLCIFAGSAAAQTTSLSASPSPAFVGHSVTLTASVTGATAPAGSTVTFYNGVTVLGSAAVNSATGKAILRTMMLPASSSNGLALTAQFFTSAHVKQFPAAPATLQVTGATGVDLGNLTTGGSVRGGNRQILAADFNNDGVMDFAIYGGGSVDILLGNPVGGGTPNATFAEPANFTPLGAACNYMVSADFNGDGNADLACDTNGHVSIFLGQGNGNFTLVIAPEIGSILPYVVVPSLASESGNAVMVVADFDQDGIPDLVLAASFDPNTATGAIDFFHGLGDGTFFPSTVVYAISTVFGSGALPYALVTGDFNGDGNPDLVVAAFSAINSQPGSNSDLFFMPGNGHGGFIVPGSGLSAPGLAQVTVAQFPIVVGDFNGDGKPDIAYVDSSASPSIQVLFGPFVNSTAGGSAKTTIATPPPVGNGWLISGDFNGDGNLDLAGGLLSGGGVSIANGKGNGGFSAPFSVTNGCTGSAFPATGDFNGDNREDLAAVCANSNTTLSVELASAPLTLSSVVPASAAAGGSGIALTLTGTSFGAADTVTWTPVAPAGNATAGLATTLNPNGTLKVNLAGGPGGLLSTQGTFNITVVDPSGATSGAILFTVGPPPAISGLNPISVGAGSAAFSLTINGTGFANGDCVTWTQVTPQPASAVPLTGTLTPPCNTTVTSLGNGQAQLTVTVPASLVSVAGTATISVIDPDGAAAGTPQTFSVAPPSISGLADVSGAALTSVGTGSTNLTLVVNGANFLTGATGSVVIFTDPAGAQHVLTPTAATSTSLTVVVPGLDIGSVANTTAQVTVLNQAPAGTNGTCTAPGGITGACSTAVQLSIGAPTILNTNPTAAAAGGGNLTLTVNGSNFVANSQLVWCNNCAGTPQALIAPTTVTPGQMVLTIPTSKNLLNAPGTVQISVTNTPGNLTNANTNSTAISFQISTIGISSISPTSVLAGGPGFALTINGQNSNFDPAAQVLFGQGLAPIIPSQQTGATITSSQIIVNVPASYIATSSAGALSIQVQDSNGAITPVVSLPIQVFSIASAVPSSLTAGSPDTLLLINGTGFAPVGQMQVQWIEGIATTNLTVLSTTPTQMSVKVPGGAQGLLAQPGTAQITATETVAGGNVSATLTQAISISPPAISSPLLPSSSPVNGTAFLLTVNGSSFLSSSVIQWTDGTGKVTPLTTSFTSSQQLSAFVPSTLLNAAGTALVTVSNGTAVSNGIVFPIGPTPTILTNGNGLAICPATGTCQASTSVTAGTAGITLQVSGLNYQPGAVVVWAANGVSTNLVTGNLVTGSVNNPNSTVTAAVPATLLATPTTVLITVQNPGNAISNGVLFTVSTGLTPVLTTATPVGNVTLGSPIQLAITGANFANGALVQWNNGAVTTGLATVFIDVNDLSALVPSNLVSAPGTVSITVQSAGATSNALPFSIAPIAITSLTTTSALAGSGPISLTVTGGNFTASSTVQWTGGAGPQPLPTTLISTSELSVVVPATLLATAGTAFVSVATGTLNSNSLPFTITATSGPTLSQASSLNPSSAVVTTPGLTLNVAGANFVNGAVVMWNTGTAVTLTTAFVSATQLTALVPASLLATVGTAIITVQNPDKTISNGVTFVVVSGQTPILTTVTTVGSVLIGSAIQLAISGSNFAVGSVVQWINGATTTALATTFIDANDLSAVVPANLVTAPGTVSISVLSAGATSASKAFTIPTITITSLLPDAVTVGGPTFPLTVSGQGFTASSVIQWTGPSGPQSLTTNMISTTQLSALVPASLIAATGTPFISVVTGTLTSNSLPLTVSVTNAPTITSLGTSSVQAGSAGIQITVIGTNFVNGSVVQWNGGGTPQTLSSAFASSTELTALVPALLMASPATVFIGVQNPNNGGVSNLVSFTVAPVAGPTIGANGLVPASALTGSPGVTLTVNGANFENGAVVQWNTTGTATPLTTGFVNSSQLTALVPASVLVLPATALITVQNADKTISNALTFSVVGSAPVATPTLTSIAPAIAAAGSPTLLLTVIGQNFVSATNTTSGSVVQWNGAAVPTNFSSPTQLTATVDASLLQATGSNFVSVLNGTFSSAGVKFQVNGPTLASLAPATVTAGSQPFSIVLTGTNFVTGSTALWNNSSLATSVNSATQLTAQVPANLVATAGSAFVLVTNPGGSSTTPQMFTIATPAAPTVSTLSPAFAVAGGAAFQLSVAGSGFVSGSVVMWNGSPLATGFVSATQVTALISSTLIAIAGNANVTVQNPGAPLSTPVQFAISGPTITSLTPATANAGDPGFSMTVVGTNFVPGASVLWNGTVLPSAFSSATQLIASVPAINVASAGTASVTVQNPGGAASTSQAFTIGQPSLTMTTATLPDGIVGTAYSQVLAAQGGTPPYTWTLAAGNLPGGLSLNPSSGTLSGTPTGASGGTLGITVTDSLARVATRSLQLNIVLALTITTAPQLTMATAGTAYSAILAATGGTPSYLWSVGGTLPPGLIFNVATGQISGVPTTPGSYTFTVGVTDSRQQQNASQSFTLGVTVALLNITGLNPTVGPAQQIPLNVTVGTPYTVDLTGTLTVTFTSAVGGDDPSIQFSTVGRTVSFTIPNGTTTAVYPQNQQLLLSTGTLAGTITVRATLQAGAADITPTGLAPVTTTVPKVVPVITSATLTTATGGVVVTISGYSTTKEATQAALQFNAASGSTVTSGTVTVPLTATLAAWYQSAAASGFGSQFTVTIPIGIQGSTAAIGSVTITMTNTQGNSAPVTTPLSSGS